MHPASPASVQRGVSALTPGSVIGRIAGHLTPGPVPLGARGKTPAAFDRRCIPPRFVAPRSHAARHAPSSRRASRAPPRSRCHAGFHHGLLGAGRLLRVEPGPRQPAVLLSTWQIALPRHNQLDAAGHPPCVASAETGARHAPLLHYRVVAPEAETRRPVTRLALQGQVSPHAPAHDAEPGGTGPRLRHGPSRGKPRAVTCEVELSRRSLELTRHHVLLCSPAVHPLSTSPSVAASRAPAVAS